MAHHRWAVKSRDATRAARSSLTALFFPFRMVLCSPRMEKASGGEVGHLESGLEMRFAPRPSGQITFPFKVYFTGYARQDLFVRPTLSDQAKAWPPAGSPKAQAQPLHFLENSGVGNHVVPWVILRFKDDGFVFGVCFVEELFAVGAQVRESDLLSCFFVFFHNA